MKKILNITQRRFKSGTDHGIKQKFIKKTLSERFKQNIKQLKKKINNMREFVKIWLKKFKKSEQVKNVLLYVVGIGVYIGVISVAYPVLMYTADIVMGKFDSLKQLALDHSNILSKESLDIIEDYESRLRQIVLNIDYNTDKLQVVETISDHFYNQYWLISPGAEPVEISFEKLQKMIANGEFQTQEQKKLIADSEDLKKFKVKIITGLVSGVGSGIAFTAFCLTRSSIMLSIMFSIFFI